MTHTQNPWQRTSARHVAERYLVALSMAQAWETLGLNPRDNPSDAEINAAYRAKIRSLIQADPESVKDQVMMSPLNQAKDLVKAFRHYADTGKLEVITGESPGVTYGKVTPYVARRIVREHVAGGKIVSEFVIESIPFPSI